MSDYQDELEFKNLVIFYSKLYERFFLMITNIIDENTYNIIDTKEQLRDFLNSYSYYLIENKLITKELAESKANTLYKELQVFDEFTKGLDSYPTKKYSEIRFNLAKKDYSMNSLTQTEYILLTNEYYAFYEEVISIIRNFVNVASESGFFPTTKKAVKSIGYANYNFFFTELEKLKLKVSDITTKVNVTNLFKVRRCMYTVLIVFSPYYRNKEVYYRLEKELDFKEIMNEDNLKALKEVFSYDNPFIIRNELNIKVNKVLVPLINTSNLIKRFISYEFGERDITPKRKKKYAYDPTGV